TYAADGLHSASASTPIDQLVKQAPSQTLVATSQTPVAYGNPVTFTASVTSSAGVPTGTVTFTDGTVSLGTASVDAGGEATSPAITFTGGIHHVAAQYGGDTNFGPSSGTVAQQVTTTQ